MTDTFSNTILIVNKRVLHARAAAKFVKAVAEHDADITVEKGDNTANGYSIMGLLMLGASINTKITIISSGNDAKKALDYISNLVNRGFDEE